MNLRERELIGDKLGVPRTYEEMELAMERNYVIPAFRDGNITVDKLLDHVDVKLDWYIPSEEAMDFMNFFRLVLGEEPENANPKAHYFLIDCIFKKDIVEPYFKVRNVDYESLKDYVLVLCTREFSKSVLLGTVLVLYIAAKGKLPGYGKVNYMLYVSDSMRNNVKTTMETIGAVYRESAYLREIFEDAVTNQDEISFTRKPSTKKDKDLYDQYVNQMGMKRTEVPGRMKRTFSMKGLGAATGGRGSRDALFRPQGVFFDDMLGNEKDAESEIILDNIESTIESDVLKALSGKGSFAILAGTPYNKKDPAYRRIEEGSWLPIVFPKAEKMDDTIDEKNFKGVWEDRHSYKQCKKDYVRARKSADHGNPLPLRKLNQEYYLRISNDEDRLIPESLVQFYSREKILADSWAYNWYITTDYTSTGNKGSDLSGNALWAVDDEQNHFLVDLSLRKLDLERQYGETFAMVTQCTNNTRGVQVGIETDGQQNVHLLALRDRMSKRATFFRFARQKGSNLNSEGIKSKLEGGNKHWRFRMMLPYFQNRKIWFPQELKGTQDMNELLEEIKYTTYSGFGSTHDDGIDLISQLNAMEISYPPKGLKQEYTEEKAQLDGMNSKIWNKKKRTENDGYNPRDSYT